MRVLALLFSFVLLIVSLADAQAARRKKGTRAPAPAAAQQETASPVSRLFDSRPRMKRDDVPAAAAPAAPAATAAAPAATPATGKKKRSARRGRGAPAEAVQAATGVAGARSSKQDAAACAAQGQPDAIIAGCTRVIEDGKQKPKPRAAALYNRGNAYSAQGEHDKAIADYDEALKIEPKSASIFNNRGNARNDKGDAEGAIADFDAAIKANAKYAAAYFNRGNVRAAQGDFDKAVADYGLALKFNKRYLNAYIARGSLLLASGATAKARSDFAQANRLAPKVAYAVLWHDIAEKRAKQKGVLGKGKAPRIDMSAWPAPVIRLYQGEAQVDAVIAEADNPNPTVKDAHVCEANFYSGAHALIGGNRDEAVKLFRTAAKGCPRGFLEGIAAAAELKGMGEKVEAN